MLAMTLWAFTSGLQPTRDVPAQRPRALELCGDCHSLLLPEAVVTLESRYSLFYPIMGSVNFMQTILGGDSSIGKLPVLVVPLS